MGWDWIGSIWFGLAWFAADGLRDGDGAGSWELGVGSWEIGMGTQIGTRALPFFLLLLLLLLLLLPSR